MDVLTESWQNTIVRFEMVDEEEQIANMKDLLDDKDCHCRYESCPLSPEQKHYQNCLSPAIIPAHIHTPIL